MAVFLVSFDIKYDYSYQERYSSFVKEVQKTSPWWADNTTFIVVEINESIRNSGHKYTLKKKIRSRSKCDVRSCERAEEHQNTL